MALEKIELIAHQPVRRLRRRRKSFLRHCFSALRFSLELLDQGLHFFVSTQHDIGQYTEDTAEE